jgi:hypothetical protein
MRFKTYQEWINNLRPSDGGEETHTDSHATRLEHRERRPDRYLNTSQVLLATPMGWVLEGRVGYRRCFLILNWSKR